MRISACFLALLSSFALPVVASASPVPTDTFTLTTSSGTYIFTLPSSLTVPDPVGGSNDFDQDVSFSGTTSGTMEIYFDVSGNIAFTSSQIAGGFFSGTTPTFSGSTNSPTFLPGDYTFTSGVTLDIAPSAAPTPEPSSLLLIGTGLFGVTGFFRRRGLNR